MRQCIWVNIRSCIKLNNDEEIPKRGKCGYNPVQKKIQSGGNKCTMQMRLQNILLVILPEMKQVGDIKDGDNHKVVWQGEF